MWKYWVENCVTKMGGKIVWKNGVKKLGGKLSETIWWENCTVYSVKSTVYSVQ